MEARKFVPEVAVTVEIIHGSDVIATFQVSRGSWNEIGNVDYIHVNAHGNVIGTYLNGYGDFAYGRMCEYVEMALRDL